MKLLLATPVIALLFAACNSGGLKPEKLNGEWKYIKIDHPKGDDLTDTLGANELATHNAYIKFSNSNQLEIWWDGKILSHGTFGTQGENIQYTEQLANGKTRTFPFCLSRIDNKSLVFETLGPDGSRVVAVRR